MHLAHTIFPLKRFQTSSDWIRLSYLEHILNIRMFKRIDNSLELQILVRSHLRLSCRIVILELGRMSK